MSASSARPPANAWRKAASANGTVRPICLAYVAACIATALSNGKGSGQRSGLQAAALGARAEAVEHDVALGGAAERLVGLGPGQRGAEDRDPLGRDRHRLQHPLGEQVRVGATEVEVEGRSVGHCAYPWMSQPSAARAASMTASESVGWPWMIRATSL